MTVYKNIRIIDGTGTPAIENAMLVTNESKILYAGAENKAPKEYLNTDIETVDLKGKTVLPGLFNCHVHMALRFPFLPYKVDEYKTPAYRAMVMYRRAVESMCCGVTTMRAVGEADHADLAVRDAINKNMMMGARILTAGPVIIAHGGHGAGGVGAVECSGAAEFARAARLEIADGVDLIKLCITGGMVGEHEGADTMQMTKEEISAVTQVAHGAGKIVAGHLGNDYAIKMSVESGVDCVEHAYILGTQTAEYMAKQGTYLVPTLAVSAACSYLEAHNNPSYHIEKIRAIGKTHMKSASNAIEAGVKICVGTDLLASDPLDGTNATVREMELLNEAGLSNLETIKAATGRAAELCQVADIVGTLEAGKEADFIAVDGKPDMDMSHMRNLCLVAKGGSLVWSTVEGYEKKGFSILPFGEMPEGASFINW